MAKTLLHRLPRERMTAEQARFKVDLGALLTPHDMIWKDGPPATWMYGAPIGNGDFGAIIYGFPDSLSFALAKTDVWQRYEYEGDAFPGPNFAAFRKTYFDKDEAAFDRMEKEAGDRLANPRKAPHLTTCGTLRLTLDAGLNARNCSMRVELRRGIMELAYRNRRVRALVSREYDVLIIEIDRGAAEPRHASFADGDPSDGVPWEFFRLNDHDNPPMEFSENGGLAFATQSLGLGTGFTAGIAVAGFDAPRTAVFPCRLCGSAEKAKSRKVHFYVAIVSSADAADPAAECRRRLERAIAAGPEQITRSHCEWWEEYWMRGLAAVGDAAVEKWYYRSLYLCGSILRPGRQSPGLQGVWAADLHPAWCGDYHANLNIQSVYWGLMTNNRLDLMEPYLRLYDGFADHSRKIARDYFGMRGLRLPFAASIAGNEFTVVGYATLTVSPCETPWLAQLFWQYYEFSQDRNFLAETGYPILRDAARFLSDYLIRDAATGKYALAPVVHMETRCPGFAAWGENSLYANAMFRMGFVQAIRAAETLGVDKEECEEWRERLENLPPPPTTPEGIFKEFENHDLLKSSCSYLFYLAFPAELVSVFHGPPEWLATARATWKRMQSEGEWCLSGKPWCGGEGLCELLRIGEADEAFRRARWGWSAAVLGFGAALPENGFIIAHNADFVQVDHAPGMCRVLADMLLLGTDGVVHLFPGIPTGVPARFLSLRAPGGFLVTAERRAEWVDYVLVEPTAEGTFRLQNPWRALGCAVVTDLADGAVIARTPEDIISVRLQPGRRYRIAGAAFSPESLPVVNFAFESAPAMPPATPRV